MWLIWGSIITNDADDMKDSGICRMDEFWWMQVSAYIATGVFGCCGAATGVQDKDKTSIQDKLVPSTPLAIGCKVVQTAWSLGYSIYAIVLWDSLSDQYMSAGKCGDLITVSSEGDDFIILWKVTACMYFIGTLLSLLLLAFVVYINCCLEAEGSSHPLPEHPPVHQEPKLQIKQAPVGGGAPAAKAVEEPEQL